MSLATLVIKTNEDSEKERSFSALLLGYVLANEMLPCEAGKSVRRPVWLCVGTSDDEMRPFLANLRTGRRAEGRNDKFELLKTAGYHFSSQRTSAGTVVTAYLPDLFRVDPGMVDPSGVKFVAMPPQSWIEDQKNSLRDSPAYARAIKHVSRLMNSDEWLNHMGGDDIVPMSTLFCAYLDRRTRCPLVPDLEFQLQLTVAMLQSNADIAFSGRVKYQRNLEWRSVEELGYAQPIGCQISHEKLEEFLAEQVSLYMREKKS